jgi:hypothetical protein
MSSIKTSLCNLSKAYAIDCIQRSYSFRNSISVDVTDNIINISITSDNFDSVLSNFFIPSYAGFHCGGHGHFGERLMILRYV